MKKIDSKEIGSTPLSSMGEMIAFIVIINMGLSLFASDVFVPGLPSIASQLHVLPEKAESAVSLFFLAFAVGQLVFGPLSDRFGRRRVLLWAIILLALSSLGCGFATTFNDLLILRALQAVGASAGSVVGRAVLNDIFSGHDLVRVSANSAIMKAIAPVIAPLLGGILVTWFGWHAPFFLTALLAAASCALVIIYLPETNRSLERTATNFLVIITGYQRIIKSREFLKYTITPGLLNGGLVAIVANLPFILIVNYNITKVEYGILHGTHTVCFVLGVFASKFFIKRTPNEAGIESRLMIILAAYVILASIFSWICGANIKMWAVLSISLAYCWIMGFISPFLAAKGIAAFTDSAGASSSVQGFIYYGIAAAIGWISHTLGGGSSIWLPYILTCTGALALIAMFLLESLGNRKKISA